MKPHLWTSFAVATVLLLASSSSAAVSDVSIAVSESISPASVAPGETATISFSATNNGSDVAQFYLVLSLGPGSWSVGSPSQGSGPPFSCSRPDDFDIVCSIDPLTAGTAASFSVPVTLGSGAVPGQILDSRVNAFQGMPGGAGLGPTAARALVVAAPPAGGGGGGTPSTSTLSVALQGAGSGTVTSLPGGISCGSVCASAYARGASVTLSAMPAEGSVFAGWGDACASAGAAAQCVVSIDADRAVTASFDLAPTTAKPPPPVVCAVPRLVGWRLVRAKQRLTHSHCRIGTITRRPLRASLVGKVVSQRPAAGARLRAGSKVAVVVGQHE